MINSAAAQPLQSNLIADAYGANSATSSNTKSESAGSTAVGQASKSAGAKEAQGANKTSDDIQLSPRAQRAEKIKLMADDFFSNGQFGLDDLPKLVARLEKDGILSSSQVDRLAQSGIKADTKVTDKTELSTFISEQSAAIAKQDPKSPLLDMLQEADKVLKNMEDTHSPVLAQRATRVTAQLADYLNNTPEMPEKEKSQWQGLKSVMQVASSLGSNQQASGQLSSYLALARR